jgi:DNA-binding NarL/FixJ family response regulator
MGVSQVGMDSNERGLESDRSKIRILVVDDHPVVRGFICRLLNAESQFEVVGEAVTGMEAVARAKESQPDVVLLDVSLPDMGGLAVTPCIKEVAPSAQILILSEHDGPIVHEAFRAGATGYVLKSDSTAELAIAVRTVKDGRRYLGARFTPTLKQAI